MTELEEARLAILPQWPSGETSDWDLAILLAGVGRRWGMPLFELRLRYFLSQETQDRRYDRLPSPGELEHNLMFRNLLYPDGGETPNWPRLQVIIEMYPSMFATGSSGKVPIPADGERCLGHHAVTAATLAEAEGEAGVGFLHNLGVQRPSWGAGGKGLLTWSYLNRYMVEAWLVDARPPRRQVEHTVTELVPKPADVGLDEPIRILSPFSRDDFRITVSTSRLMTHQGVTYAFASEIREEGVWVQIGWLFAKVYFRNPDQALIQEFFVWPHFRCVGYGTHLIGIAGVWLELCGVRGFKFLYQTSDQKVNESSDFPPRIPRWLCAASWHEVGKGGIASAWTAEWPALLRTIVNGGYGSSTSS